MYLSGSQNVFGRSVYEVDDSSTAKPKRGLNQLNHQRHCWYNCPGFKTYKDSRQPSWSCGLSLKGILSPIILGISLAASVSLANCQWQYIVEGLLESSNSSCCADCWQLQLSVKYGLANKIIKEMHVYNIRNFYKLPIVWNSVCSITFCGLLLILKRYFGVRLCKGSLWTSRLFWVYAY